MDAFWNNGIAMVVWFQGLGGWLVLPMKFFSFLGTETFFLLLVPLLYWSVDAGLGLRLGCMVMFTGAVNGILKLSFHAPRPYWFSPQVKAYLAETSFGVPSAHAQTAAGLFGLAAGLLKRRWGWLLAFLLIIMIGLSRIYLGVHFPFDVLAGWAIGAFILWGFIHWWDGLAVWVKQKSLGQQIGLAFALSIIFLVLGSIAFGSLRGWVLPPAWFENARISGADVMPAPVTLDSTITPAALLFGVLAGVAWMNSRGGFSAKGSLAHRLLRLLPGLAGIMVIYLGLKVIFPGGDSLLAYILRYLRYGLVGLWLSAGAPWVFYKLNLAGQE